MGGFGYAKVGLDLSLEVDSTENCYALHEEQELALEAVVKEGEGANDVRDPGENKKRNNLASVLLSPIWVGTEENNFGEKDF